MVHSGVWAGMLANMSCTRSLYDDHRVLGVSVAYCCTYLHGHADLLRCVRAPDKATVDPYVDLRRSIGHRNTSTVSGDARFVESRAVRDRRLDSPPHNDGVADSGNFAAQRQNNCISCSPGRVVRMMRMESRTLCSSVV